MDFKEARNAEARRRGEEKFAKAKRRDTDIMEYQRQIQAAETAKFIRLRALRLAKEAADKQAAEAAAAAAPPVVKRAPRPRRPKVEVEKESEL
jgi:hypothetical protein